MVRAGLVTYGHCWALGRSRAHSGEALWTPDPQSGATPGGRAAGRVATGRPRLRRGVVMRPRRPYAIG